MSGTMTEENALTGWQGSDSWRGFRQAEAFYLWLQQADKSALTAMLHFFFQEASEEEREKLFAFARELREHHYGRRVYFRGLIEFSNYCKNDCYYCGIRKSNGQVKRYRLTEEEILSCCKTGYDLGFRTFVLQGGEDSDYNDERLCRVVGAIKSHYPDCALTLSVGEREKSSYEALFSAGTDRFLLRHETADESHYAQLHPQGLSGAHRKSCLFALKEIGFQVGAGLMVDSPFQTNAHLAEDLLFLRELQPQMVGVGPFIPHQDTPFAGYVQPESRKTIILLALIRILLPKALLPATTALGTVDDQGREKALQAGANVVMPNLSPLSVRKDYALYDNKICTGEEAAECLLCLSERIQSAGYFPDFSRGDHADMQRK